MREDKYSGHTYLGSLPLNCIPKWLLHKDMFNKITIEEDIGHIELMKRLNKASYSKSISAFQRGSFTSSKCDLGIYSVVREKEKAL